MSYPGRCKPRLYRHAREIGASRFHLRSLACAAMRLIAAIATLLAAAAIVACGGDEATNTPSEPTSPSAAEFPAGDGQSLEQLVSDYPEGPVMAQTVTVTRKGRNRIAFALFDLERKQVRDADVAIYVLDKDLTGARGPYVATSQSLDVKAQYRSRQTAADLGFNETIYSAEVELPTSGDYVIAGIAKIGGKTYRTSQFALRKPAGEQPPDIGEQAPKVKTLTEADVGGNLAAIDTRIPPLPDLHEENAAATIGSKPTVLLFATPQFCQSRVCGPVDDVLFQVASDPKNDGVAFIHQEIYEDNEISKGFRTQVRAYDLPTEPWAFVIDRGGVIRDRFEGAFSVAELQAAVDKVR